MFRRLLELDEMRNIKNVHPPPIYRDIASTLIKSQINLLKCDISSLNAAYR